MKTRPALHVRKQIDLTRPQRKISAEQLPVTTRRKQADTRTHEAGPSAP